MGLTLNGVEPQASSWPIATVASGENILASQYNVLLAGVQTWPGAVDAAGWSFSHVGSQLWAGPVNAGGQTVSYGVFDATNTFPVATASYAGVVKAGSGIEIAGDGTLNGNVEGFRLLTANGALLPTDCYVAFGSAVTSLTMPTNPLPGQVITIASSSTTATTLTAQAGGQMVLWNGVIFAGSPTATIGPFCVLTLTWDGSVWRPKGTAFLQLGISGYLGYPEPATAATAGLVKIGSGIQVAGDGTIDVIAGAPQINSDWNAVSGVAQILNRPNLAVVATSGSYNDLLNKPTIPAAQVQSDWMGSGMAAILHQPPITWNGTVMTASADLHQQSGNGFTILSADGTTSLQFHPTNASGGTAITSNQLIAFYETCQFISNAGIEICSPTGDRYLEVSCENGGDPVIYSSTGKFAATSPLLLTGTQPTVTGIANVIYFYIAADYSLWVNWIDPGATEHTFKISA